MRRSGTGMYCLKSGGDGAEVMSDDSSFQRLAPEIGKVRLPTVVRRKVGAVKRLENLTIRQPEPLRTIYISDADD